VKRIDHVLAFGSTAAELMTRCAGASVAPVSDMPRLGPDQALLWSRVSPTEFRVLRIDAPRQGHERHRGKYALGDVGETHSFYFARSPDGSVRRARNLAEFIAQADAVPDDIWERHLRAGDFTAWFLHVIRDEELGRRAREVASDGRLGAQETRQRIAEAIRERYTIPSNGRA
jgi:hypothetical protein